MLYLQVLSCVLNTLITFALHFKTKLLIIKEMDDHNERVIYNGHDLWKFAREGAGIALKKQLLTHEKSFTSTIFDCFRNDP